MIESDLASSNCRTSDLGHWNNITKSQSESCLPISRFIYAWIAIINVRIHWLSRFNTQYAWLSGSPGGLWEIVANCCSNAESRFNNTRICIAEYLICIHYLSFTMYFSFI